jgi:hypothetical protein
MYRYILICIVFNDVVNGSECTVSNDKMINEQWVGKDVDESSRGPKNTMKRTQSR